MTKNENTESFDSTQNLDRFLIESTLEITPERVLNMREYDEAASVYKNYMQELLRIVFGLMEQANREKAPNVNWSEKISAQQLNSVLTDSNLKDLLIACNGQPIFASAKEYIDRASSGKGVEFHTLQELRGNMNLLAA